MATLRNGKIAVLAIEAGRSLLLGRDEILKTAQKNDLALVAVAAK